MTSERGQSNSPVFNATMPVAQIGARIQQLAVALRDAGFQTDINTGELRTKEVKARMRKIEQELYDYAKELMGYDDIPRSREEWEARFGAEY